MRRVSKSIPEDTAFDRDITLHIHLTCSVCAPPPPSPLGDFRIILCAKRRSTIACVADALNLLYRLYKWF